MSLPLATLFFALVSERLSADVPTPIESTVGMGIRMEEVVLPGPELEAVPNDDRKLPLVVRIAHVYPHGTAFRYDLECYGLEPGSFDLKDYLRRKDGSSSAGLPSIPIKVTPVLPPGQVMPNALQIEKSPFLGGYRTLRIFGAVAWILGFSAIVYYGFIRRKKQPDTLEEQKQLSLAERIGPLVEGAVAGKLSQAELAGLERMLLAYWRKRLKLEDADPAKAMDVLRSHAEAGPLIEQLEIWLHRPGTAASVDPTRLLEPYRRIPAGALEEVRS
jgi:hypothetical protein